MVELVNFIREREINLSVLKNKLKFYDEISRMSALISEVMDFNESKNENRFCVKSEVDPELDACKSHRFLIFCVN